MSLPFYLPFDDFARHPALNKQTLASKIVVVAHIGKVNLCSGDDYPSAVHYIFGKKGLSPPHLDDPYSLCRIEGRYVFSDNVLHLYLSGPWCIKSLSPVFKRLLQQMNEMGFLKCWDASTNNYARALLFIFALSHVIVIHHPSETPDYATLQILKLLSYIRPQQQILLKNLLMNSLLSDEEWIHQGRLCPPRLLFAFKCPHDIKIEPTDAMKITRIRKLERSLEDLIYFALRKSRTVKYSCNRAFFSIAPNDEFVHVENPQMNIEPLERTLQKLNLAGFLRPVSIDCSYVEEETDSDDEEDIKYMFDYSSTLQGHTFERFLQIHITKAHEEGFLDNMGKYTNVKPFFQKPSLGNWLHAANIILDDPDFGFMNSFPPFGFTGHPHTNASTVTTCNTIPDFNVAALPIFHPCKPALKPARHHKGSTKPSRQDRRDDKRLLQIHRKKRHSPERVWNPFEK